MRTARAKLTRRKNEVVFEAILDAAEKLIREGSEQEFTMRALAEEAGVSVVTAYNHFGSKSGVMRGIVQRMVEEIRRRYQAMPPQTSVADRILAMADAGVQVSIEQSQLYRTVSRSLLFAPERRAVEGLRFDAEGLWRDAMGDSWREIRSDVAEGVDRILPMQLAVIYRGALTLWIAGEVDDKGFGQLVMSGTATVLLAFVHEKRRADLVAVQRA